MAFEISEQDQSEVTNLIQAALLEDLRDHGDVTTLATIPPDSISNGYFIAKQDGVCAGLSIASQVFHHVDPNVTVVWTRNDGDFVPKGTKIGTITGPSQSILTAERLALNIMQRMGGVATQTYRMMEEIRRVGSRTQLLDTRKTAPGMRVLDKLAVRMGGGTNHRKGLYDMVMIKDNHIAAAGGIPQAMEAVVSYLAEKNLDVRIEVEASTLEEVEIAMNDGRMHRIMLDNMVKFGDDGSINTDMLVEALRLIDGRFETEASGNITLHSIGTVAATGVQFASCGSLTHSVTAMDISLKFLDNSKI